MRLIGAELLKMRRRTMTYVLPGIVIGVLAFVYLVIGSLVAPVLGDFGGIPMPPGVQVSAAVASLVGEFVFGLGSLLAVIYAGAIIGGDYTWGVMRNPIARGESRENYLLAKAAGLAIVIAIGALLCFLVGVVIIAVLGAVFRVDLSGLYTLDGVLGLARSLGLGTLVLFERAAIGIAVALIMRSQLAGIVVAVVLYIAEPLVAGLATAISSVGSAFDPEFTEPALHWSQFLPFSIGSSVLNEAPAALGGLAGEFELVRSVPLHVSVPVLLLYLAGAILLAMIVLRRQEIT